MSNKVLKVTHNAGFFSCCSIRLFEIVNYFNTHKELPEVVDSSEQFQVHKYEPGDITQFFFDTLDDEILYDGKVSLTRSDDELQFSNYELINFDRTFPFVKKYFSPSEGVRVQIQNFVEKYNLDFDNLCGVFYRGLDKSRETEIADYDTFINKCIEVKKMSNVRFLVQTDELEFLNLFLQTFPDSIFLHELPTTSKADVLMTHLIAPFHRVDFGVKFLSATLILSKCKYLITHSGNCSNWCVLFRNSMEGVYQFITSYKDTGITYSFWNK